MDNDTCQECYRSLEFCEELKTESVDQLGLLLELKAKTADPRLAEVLDKTIVEWRTHVVHECSPVSLA